MLIGFLLFVYSLLPFAYGFILSLILSHALALNYDSNNNKNTTQLHSFGLHHDFISEN